MVERHGRRVVIREEGSSPGGDAVAAQDYASLIQGDVDRAEDWSWDWPGPDDEVAPASRDASDR